MVRLRTIFADVLADLKLPQFADKPGAENQGKEQRRQAGVCRPEGDVAEQIEDSELVVKGELEIVKHLSPV